MKKEIEKKSVLGGGADKSTTTHPVTGATIEVDLSGEKKRDYSPEAVKKELKEKGLNAYEEVEVENPVTGQKSIVKLERDGTTESKLIIALADKSKTRDQKDSILGMYLFERGKESASFLTDLFRYKGAHTKESRAFKSQMRFDFEMFVNLFTNHLDALVDSVIDELGYTKEEFKELADGYVKYLKNKPERKSFFAYADSLDLEKSSIECAMIQIAIRNLMEADRLRDAVQNVTKARERENGKGIYIDNSGKVYSVEDPDIDDVIKKDKERIEELNNQE